MSLLNGFGVFGSVPAYVQAASSRRVALIAGPNRRYVTVQGAVNAANNGDAILIDPGEYAENVVIPHSKQNLVLVGMGGRGSVAIQALTDGVAITNHARDVTLVNIGGEGDGAGGGVVNYGRRFRASGCKFEGGALALKLTLGTDAQITAGSHDKGDDTLLEDCEIAYADVGVELVSTDYGAVTQNFFKRCYFHSLPDASFEESGGSAGVRYRGLLIDECTFGAGDEETDALPTKWISLDDDNANSGVVSRCIFPAAINSGLNLCSTGLRWIGNFHTGGVAGAQPS